MVNSFCSTKLFDLVFLSSLFYFIPLVHMYRLRRGSFTLIFESYNAYFLSIPLLCVWGSWQILFPPVRVFRYFLPPLDGARVYSAYGALELALQLVCLYLVGFHDPENHSALGGKWRKFFCPAPGVEYQPSAWNADTIAITLRWYRYFIIISHATAHPHHKIHYIRQKLGFLFCESGNTNRFGRQNKPGYLYKRAAVR